MTDLTGTTYRRLALAMILIGIVLGIDSVLSEPVLYRFWPLVLLLPATGFIGIFAKRRSQGDMFLVVGVYLLCFSGLALYCSLAGWSQLRDLWPLFIAFLGLALLVLSCFHRDRRLQLFLGLLALGLAVFFFLILSFGGHFWWTSLIVVGIAILLARRLT